MTKGQQEWQLDGSAPELYQRYLVPAMTAMWAADLVEAARLRPGQRVLDVACGTGVVARAAAEQVGPGGRVVGLDINPGMLAVARSLPVPVEWHEGSALALPFPAASFDVALCQLGLQFFPDRLLALREMRRVLTPGGCLGLNVFGPIEHNPATYAMANALDRHVDPGASVAKRTEHALADTEALRALVSEAGFENVAIRTQTKTVHFPSTVEYVRAQLAATPLASVVAGLGDRGVNALIEDVGVSLAAYATADGLAFPQEVHVVLAR